jgi:hypothetical protein
MLHDLFHTALVSTDAGVALDIAETTGDNPVSGKELSDLLRGCITPEGKLRVVVSSPV